MKIKIIIGSIALVVTLVILKFNIFSDKLTDPADDDTIRLEVVDEDGTRLSLSEYDKETTIGTKKNYMDGRLVSIAEIKDGKKNGVTKNFYSDGSVSAEVNYINDSREGKATWYHQNGGVYRVSNYKNNQLDGKRIFYYRNGKVKAELIYSNGNLIPGITEYTNTGILIEEQPSMIIKEISRVGETVKLKAYLSNEDKNAEFLTPKTLESGDQVYEIVASENGEVYIYRRTPKDGNSEKIELYALTKTKMKHDLLVKGEYNLR